MDVVSQLGPNKVTMSIKTNHYIENCNNNDSKECFAGMTDFLEAFRGLKSQPRIAPDEPSVNTCDGIASLYLIFASIIDPSISLYRGNQLQDKVQFFRDSIIKSWPLKMKELGLSRSKITEEDLRNSPLAVMTYLSKLVGKNVFFVSDKPYLWKVNDGVVVSITFADNVYSQTNDNMDLKACYQVMAKDLESKLVKEVRDIASSMSVCIYDDAKKLLPKKDLIAAIRLVL